MRLPYRAVLRESLLEFQDGVVVQLSFPIGHAKVDVEACRISESRNHILENQARAREVVQLDVGHAQQVADVKGRFGDRGYFQGLTSALIVALAEENLSKESACLHVLRIVLQNLFSHAARHGEISLPQPHPAVIEANRRVGGSQAQRFVEETRRFVSVAQASICTSSAAESTSKERHVLACCMLLIT